MADLMPNLKGKYTHLAFGLLQLTSGKMSSRKGNIITGESLIEEMRTKALEKMEERDLKGKEHDVADAVAVSAIKYSILKQARGKTSYSIPRRRFRLKGIQGRIFSTRTFVRKAFWKSLEEGRAPSCMRVFQTRSPCSSDYSPVFLPLYFARRKNTNHIT